LILVRSLAFAAFFYGWSVLIVLAMTPVFWGPTTWGLGWARLWNRGTIWGLKRICAIEVEVRGVENIPAGPAIVAANHQCMFDAFAPLSHLPKPSMAGKRELTRIPLFGWYAVRNRLMVVVDRDGHAGALRRLIAQTQAILAQGRQLLIYPQGTRLAPGETAPYKPGVAGLYGLLGAACVPMATNAGLCWPPHGILRRPGRIVFQYLEPIPPGLKRAAFMAELETRIETAAKALMAEGR
jgi:1-acyl-sn-glycerol-3-phosphate acyltransferase